MMDKRNKRRYFETLRKSLKDGARTAVMNASSESQIDRIQRLFKSKDDAIKDCAMQYSSVQGLGEVTGKDEILDMINDAVEIIMQTTSSIELKRIINLSSAKIYALIGLEAVQKVPSDS